jgi:hypothetical protein
MRDYRLKLQFSPKLRAAKKFNKIGLLDFNVTRLQNFIPNLLGTGN